MPDNQIKIIVPYYRAACWAELSLSACLTLAERPRELVFSVVSMADTDQENDLIRQIFDSKTQKYGARLIWQWIPQLNIGPENIRLVGGQPLSAALYAGMQVVPNCPLAMALDTDAILLARGWDSRIRDLLCHYVLAAINPRNDFRGFSGVAEWNLMAFRSDFYFQHVKKFSPEYDEEHKVWDIGHRFTRRCKEASLSQYLWPFRERPFPGRAPTLCGDDVHRKFALHIFYSSRRYQDPECAKPIEMSDEQRWILTEAEESQCITLARQLVEQAV